MFLTVLGCATAPLIVAFAALTCWWGEDRVRALTLAGGLASTASAPLTAMLAGHLRLAHHVRPTRTAPGPTAARQEQRQRLVRGQDRKVRRRPARRGSGGIGAPAGGSIATAPHACPRPCTGRNGA